MSLDSTFVCLLCPAHVRLERLCDARVEPADDAEEEGQQRGRAVSAELLVPAQEIIVLVVGEQRLSFLDVGVKKNAFVCRKFPAALLCLHERGRHFLEVASCRDNVEPRLWLATPHGKQPLPANLGAASQTGEADDDSPVL